jgi:hypothetical protein
MEELEEPGLAAEDVLERGFQLAYFILPSRIQAMEVLAGALNKLSAQRRRERRRSYWRDKYLKRAITRITREEVDVLQWLILFESDRLEKQQESRGEQTLDDMAVRYIKVLVRLTTAMSSFYVNIGLHRLLHNYSTPEIQQVYEMVTDRYLGGDEYRRAKSVVMTKLEKRFGPLLKTVRSQYGELRFEAWEDQQPWSVLTERSLQTFTPWSTSDSCPVLFGGKKTQEPKALADESADQSPDQLETNRCHIFIDPECYRRLTRVLNFDPPEQRLALPRFFMDISEHESRDKRPPTLTQEERKKLYDDLHRESGRRDDSSSTRIRVLVDGSELVSFDLGVQKQCDVEIEEGAELVELVGEDGSGDLLLAAHRVAYSESRGIAPSQASVQLKESAIELNIKPDSVSTGDQLHRARLSMTWEPAATYDTQKRHSTQIRGRTWWPFARLAVATLTIFVIGWAAGHYSASRPESTSVGPTLVTPSAAKTPDLSTNQSANAKPYQVYPLVPDEEIVRGSGGPDWPSVVIPSEPALLRFNLPLPPGVGKGPFLVTLKPLQGKNVLLTETVKKDTSASNTILSMWVPSTILRTGQDYTIQILPAAGNRSQEDLSSYSFRTVASGNAEPK